MISMQCKFKCTVTYFIVVTELDTLEVPPLTPTSKEVLSQAVRASFAGFTQERVSQHFPQGTARATCRINKE